MTDRPLYGVPTGGASWGDEGGDPYALWDASYVLGALTSTERREYENHLPVCGTCHAAVSELSGMPALLAMLSPGEIAAIDDGGLQPPPEQPQLLDQMVLTVKRCRRKSRWAVWSTAAAAAIVLAVGTGIIVRSVSIETAAPLSSPHASAGQLTMTAVVPSSLEATVSLNTQVWGTSVAMACTYHEETDEAHHADDAADRLALIAVGRDGTRVPLATWLAVEGGTAHPAGSTAMRLEQIAEVQVVAVDTGEVLLHREL